MAPSELPSPCKLKLWLCCLGSLMVNYGFGLSSLVLFSFLFSDASGTTCLWYIDSFRQVNWNFCRKRFAKACRRERERERERGLLLSIFCLVISQSTISSRACLNLAIFFKSFWDMILHFRVESAEKGSGITVVAMNWKNPEWIFLQKNSSVFGIFGAERGE